MQPESAQAFMGTGGSAPSPSVSTAPAQAHLGAPISAADFMGGGTVSATPPQPIPAPDTSQQADWTPITDAAKGLVTDLSQRASNIADVFSSGMNGNVITPSQAIVGGAKIASQAAGGIGDVFSAGFKALSGLLANDPGLQKLASTKGIGGALDYINNAGEQLSSDLQPTKQAIDDWSQAHPQTASLINSLGTTGLNLAGLEGGGEVEGAIKPILEEGVNATSDLSDLASRAIKPVMQSITDKATQMAVDSEKSLWTKPTETAKPAFNKASAVYDAAKSQGHNIEDTLINNGIRTTNNIEMNASGNRVFNTGDTADNLRSDAAQTSNQMLRPALEKADASGVVLKTPVQDVIDRAAQNLQSTTLTAEAKDRVASALGETKIALQKQFPEGMSLTDLHDEKIVRDLNSKYSPVGDVATNMEATKNKAVADAARAMVEEKAPSEIPVHEFNQELRKQYQAADYLDALNGKSVPKSILGNIAKMVSKGAGAAAGGALGGGILGEVAGYHIGGLLESMLANTSNPVKNMILDGLKETNPEAFGQVEDYLNSFAKSGSVANPMSNAMKNPSIIDNDTSFQPKSKTGQMIQSAAQKYASIPSKEGGFVSIGGKAFKAVPEATKQEMIQAIDYLRIGKKVPGIEDTVSRLAQKYNISEDMPSAKIANKFEQLVEDTKTSQASKRRVII